MIISGNEKCSLLEHTFKTAQQAQVNVQTSVAYLTDNHWQFSGLAVSMKVRLRVLVHVTKDNSSKTDGVNNIDTAVNYQFAKRVVYFNYTE